MDGDIARGDPAPPILDEGALAALAGSIGADGLAALLAMVPETLDTELARLDAALAAGDPAAARRAAHAVKGLAANLGLTRLREAALALDLCLRGGDAAATEPPHRALRDAAAATAAALAER